MADYGSYNNAVDFYNNIQINDRVKINISGQFKLGTVTNTNCPIIGGIKGIMITCDDNSKVVCFPKNAENLQNA